ncbi:MAG: hypothetical protein OEW17_05720 [Gemmatimonadota bacterium]|nr:hypothetical protein [Gemmatimonadota bacterium]
MICVNDPGDGAADGGGAAGGVRGADGGAAGGVRGAEGGAPGGVLGNPAMSRVNSPGCDSGPPSLVFAGGGGGGSGDWRRGGGVSCKALR